MYPFFLSVFSSFSLAYQFFKAGLSERRSPRSKLRSTSASIAASAPSNTPEAQTSPMPNASLCGPARSFHQPRSPRFQRPMNGFFAEAGGGGSFDDAPYRKHMQHPSRQRFLEPFHYNNSFDSPSTSKIPLEPSPLLSTSPSVHSHASPTLLKTNRTDTQSDLVLDIVQAN